MLAEVKEKTVELKEAQAQLRICRDALAKAGELENDFFLNKFSKIPQIAFQRRKRRTAPKSRPRCGCSSRSEKEEYQKLKQFHGAGKNLAKFLSALPYRLLFE